MTGAPYQIAAFYRFTPLDDIGALRARLKDALARLDICGSVLLAPEGINGTIAGAPDRLPQALELLYAETGLKAEDVKFSYAAEKPFQRLKIRPKKEIITFKQSQADPARLSGTYVEAADWNALMADPDVTVLDTRNAYETRIGIFEGARDPGISTFTEFADYVRRALDPRTHKKIAMYCTGGIRCEKASAFMRAEGFQEVYHLKGGILKYLETVPQTQSRWHGECYVFDRRMGVGHGLEPGAHTMCYCCGEPVSPDERAQPEYEEGVSCPRCHARTSEADKARYRMRQKQIEAGVIAA